MNELLKIDPDIHLLDDLSISNLLLYGSGKYNFDTNTAILNLSLEFIVTTKRFDEPLI